MAGDLGGHRVEDAAVQQVSLGVALHLERGEPVSGLELCQFRSGEGVGPGVTNALRLPTRCQPHLPVEIINQEQGCGIIRLHNCPRCHRNANIWDRIYSRLRQ